jgi:hypothetical protein
MRACRFGAGGRATTGSRPTARLIVSDFVWTGSDTQINSLQGKIHTYVGYARDGKMTKMHPETAGLRWHIVLRCRQGAPDARTAQVIDQLVANIRRYERDLVIEA